MFNQQLWKKIRNIGLCSAALSFTSFCQANDFSQHPDYAAFKQKTMQTYGLTAAQVDNAMYGSRNLPNIINIMNRPGESKPWYDYKAMFLTEGTIRKGVNFKNQYADTLRRAEQEFGVPQAVILGILGVETGFGSNKGGFITRDALATLGFGFPRRAEYFQDELAALIAWTYKDGSPTSSVVGSYAGAIGYPQFMPSNITKYGVDYDSNGHIDLRNSAVDAIGSIANYMVQHGWQKNQPIGFQASYMGNQPDEVIAKDLKQPTPYGAIRKLGVTPINPMVKIDDLDMVNVIQLQEKFGPVYYITYPNYQVITEYNRSRLYATAVWLLGTEIANR